VGELAALLAGALDHDRLTLAGFVDEQREDRVWPHARAKRRAEAQREHRQAFQVVVRQKQSLAGVLGDVVRMIRVARMLFVDRLVLRLAIDLPGRGVDQFADPLAQRGLGNMGGARDVEQGGGIRLPRREIHIANAGQVADGVGAGQRQLHRSQPREIARDVATAGQSGQVRWEWREIEDVDGVSTPQQLLDNVAPEEARPSGDDHVHDVDSLQRACRQSRQRPLSERKVGVKIM
jgi:hypothetical protein